MRYSLTTPPSDGRAAPACSPPWRRRDVDFLIVGREGNARYVSGAPRLWTAGSRAFGPGCVFVRATGAVHLLSTWDEGIPEEIPHENLYGITFNAMNFVTVLSKMQGAATARRVATDSMSGSSANLLPKAFPAAEFIDGEPMLRQIRRVKSPEEIEAVRASVGVAEEALAAARKALRARGHRAEADRGLHGSHGGGGGHHALRTGRGLDHLAAGSLAALRPRHAGATRRLGGLRGRRGPGGLLGGVGPDLRECGTRGIGSTPSWPSAAAPCGIGSSTACRVGAPLTDLLGAYDAVGVPQPPMPVARGLGLGFDLPLVTHALPLTSGEQHVEAGMVFALTGYVWKAGVGALYVQEPIVATDAGPESLSTTPIRRRRSMTT